MRKTTILTIITVCVVIILLILVLLHQQDASDKRKTVNIGVILPLTGSQAVYGEGVQQGLDLALEEINAKSTKKIQLIYEDHQGDIKHSVSSFQKLVTTDRVPAVISVVSQHSVALAPLAEEQHIVLYTMASQASSLNGAGRYVFKNDDDYTSIGKEAARLAVEEGHIKARIIYASYNDATVDAATAFKKTFEDLGGKVTVMEAFVKDEQNFRPLLLKIKQGKPSVLFVDGLQKDNGVILKQIKEAGLSVSIIGNAALEDPQVITASGGASEGAVFVTFQGIPEPSFAAKIKARTGKDPLRWSAEAYDGLMILNQAIQTAGTPLTAERLKAALEGIKAYDGVSGGIIFDAEGNAHRELYIKTIKDGKFVLVE